MDPGTIPGYLEQTTLHAIGHGVSWFTWWASHDINTRFSVDAMEYSMGLLDTGNRPKPQALRFRDLAAAHGGKPVSFPSRPAVAPPAGQTPEEVWAWLLDSALA